MSSVKDRLAKLKTNISKKPHIVVDTNICNGGCPHKCTTYVCPALCYTVSEDKVHFQYEGVSSAVLACMLVTKER